MSGATHSKPDSRTWDRSPEWTTRRDECGDAWNDLLNDQTNYARAAERAGRTQDAQEWRNRRWDSLDAVLAWDAEDRARGGASDE